MSLAALALLAIILATVCTGCEGVDASAAEPTSGRFEAQRCWSTGTSLRFYIITDTETGAQYLLAGDSSGYGIGYGLTVLQPGATEAED